MTTQEIHNSIINFNHDNMIKVDYHNHIYDYDKNKLEKLTVTNQVGITATDIKAIEEYYDVELYSIIPEDDGLMYLHFYTKKLS